MEILHDQEQIECRRLQQQKKYLSILPNEKLFTLCNQNTPNTERFQSVLKSG